LARSIPWPRIIAEGVAIVVSILLAFGIQAWWEGAQNRGQEREILAGLEDDFEANLNEIRRVIDEHLEYEARLVELDTMTSEALARASIDSPLPYLRPFVATYTFDARDGTLDAVISSGSLDLIRDRGVREGLVAWKRRLDDIDEEAAALMAIDHRASERMGALGGPWGPDGEGMPQVPEIREAYLRLPKPDLRIVVQDDEMMALATEKRFASLVYLYALIELRGEGEQALAAIQAQTN
jgi:hypothetical protein